MLLERTTKKCLNWLEAGRDFSFVLEYTLEESVFIKRQISIKKVVLTFVFS